MPSGTPLEPAEAAVEPAGARGLRSRPQQERRAATKASIVEAFDRLLSQGGIGALGVNALVKQAGVGKKQVYDYFGGLNGVAGAWVGQTHVWHSLEDIIGEPWEDFLQRAPAEKLRLVNVRYATSLRKNPRLCELLSGEFVQSDEVKSAVEHVRQLIRQDFEKILLSDPRLKHPDLLAFNLVAYACATYLGLRAHHQPNFFGFDLSGETSWLTVMAMFERVLELADPERTGVVK